MSSNGDVDVHALVVAMAAELEFDVSEIDGWVVCCSRQTPNGPIVSSAWSALPHWYLLGLVAELQDQIEQLRVQGGRA